MIILNLKVFALTRTRSHAQTSRICSEKPHDKKKHHHIDTREIDS